MGRTHLARGRIPPIYRPPRPYPHIDIPSNREGPAESGFALLLMHILAFQSSISMAILLTTSWNKPPAASWVREASRTDTQCITSASLACLFTRLDLHSFYASSPRRYRPAHGTRSRPTHPLPTRRIALNSPFGPCGLTGHRCASSRAFADKLSL